MARSQDVREQIRAATDIVQIVGERVRLKRRGRQYVGLCPFHDERTPSFYVTPDRGSFKCFGCGKSGDVFGFVMEMDSMTFMDSMRSLAERAGIQIPQRGAGRHRAADFERNDSVVRFAVSFYKEQLARAADRQSALTFLEGRGVTAAEVSAFGLGFAPGDGRSLMEAAAEKQITPEPLVAAGLAEVDEASGLYRDRLRGCLTFPMHAATGKIEGIAARALGAQPQDVVHLQAINRKLHSPHRAVFGLHQSKAAIRADAEVLLVPGFADVLAMHQAGIKNAVACANQVLKPAQAQALMQLTQRLVIVHDARPSSTHQVVHMLRTALAAGLRVYLVVLPQAVSPADVITKDGVAELKKWLSDHRCDFVTFLKRDYRNRRESQTPDWQDEVLCAVAAALVNITDAIMQASFVDHATAVLGVDQGRLQAAVAEARQVHGLQVGLDFYQDQLFGTAAGGGARRFLEARGIDRGTMQSFGLGYAPDAWQALVQAARARGLTDSVLVDAGLVRTRQKETDTIYFDRFRSRVIIPLVSVQGRITGMRGMGVGEAKTDQFTRHVEQTGEQATILGLHQAKDAIRAREEAFVVNDAWDLLVLHAAGITHAVAPTGKLTHRLVQMIGRFTQKVVFVTHEDDERAQRRVNLALSAGLDAELAVMPVRSCSAFVQEQGAVALKALLQRRAAAGPTRAHEAPREWLVVEGPSTATALQESGVPQVIAPSGGRLSAALAERLVKQAPRVVLVYGDSTTTFDNMMADICAALESGLDVDAVELRHKDCTAYVQEHGAGALTTYVKRHRQDFVRFIYEHHARRGQLMHVQHLDSVQHKVSGMIRHIAEANARNRYAAVAAAVDEEERTYDALAFAAFHFQRRLEAPKRGRSARAYLAKRGLNKDIVKGFGLGYAPSHWDDLLKSATGAGISAEVLEKAGLVKFNEEGTRLYDRFRGRIMFPIYSDDGDVIGFGGRILEPEEHAPKYLNTPETVVYKKSRALYGLHQSIASVQRQGEVMLVEGYTDVLAMHQAGITNAVACCGTALTSGQIKVMHALADRLLLLYDADEAGAAAALRAIELSLEGGMTPSAVSLPAGEDPASYVEQQGAGAFATYVREHRKGFIAFLHEHFSRSNALDTPEGKADAVHVVLSAISRIGAASRREEAVRKASALFGVAATDLVASLNDKVRSAAEQRQHTRWQSDSRDEIRRVHDPRRRGTMLPSEKALLKLMWDEGREMIKHIMGELSIDVFTEGSARRMAERLVELYQADAVQLAIEHFDASLHPLIDELEGPPHETSKGWEARSMKRATFNQDPARAAQEAIKIFLCARLNKRIEDKVAALRTVPEAQHPRILEELKELHTERSMICQPSDAAS